MKKINLLLAASAALLLFGCKDNKGGGIEIPTPKTQGFYILGEGSWGQNNSTLYYYDLNKSELTDRFTAANPGETLGDNANDMKIYGSKLYVAVDVSNKVLVLDAASGRILEDISMGQVDGQDREPRAVACAAGKVFVSLYSGEVARIDTTSYAVDYTPYSGSFKQSEGIVAVGESKLCVANSGFGNGNTVSVIDIPTFTVSYDITVPKNPNELAVTKAWDVYLATWPDYVANTPPALHKLNLTDKTYTTVPGVEVQKIAIDGDMLYGVSSDFTAYSSSLVKVDLTTNAVTKMVDNRAQASFNGVDVNPLSGYVYVMDGSSVLRFDEKGTELTPIANAGNRLNTVAFFNKVTK